MRAAEKIKATCPSCFTKTPVGDRPKVGNFLSCKHCGQDLELISLDPPILDLPYYQSDDDELYDDYEQLAYDPKQSNKSNRTSGRDNW